jgi:hypothetical protein
MTKREKIRILKKMHAYIETNHDENNPWLHVGLCIAYNAIYHKVQPRDLLELGITPPKRLYSHDGWWWNPDNKAPRLRAITRAIKKLQTKKS